ncbi:MAG TPA: energy transducer TonB [Bryobacteraceae bacterium]|nr:energy transducer TonB [Bryobacteraceae bacterium]
MNTRTRVFAFACAGLLFAIGNPVRADQSDKPGANSAEPYRVGGDVTAPQVLSKIDPQYDEDARAERVQGAVLISVVVGADGVPHDLSIVKSLDTRLDRKAIEAVQQWHFVPGTRQGEPVAVRATIEVNFKLQ